MSLKPACVSRIFIGAGRPTKRRGRYRGFDTGIDPAEHREKIEEVVRAAFPAGSTHYKTRGTFRGAGGRVVRESSVVVEVWLPDADAASCAEHLRLTERTAAKLRGIFGQESVAVVANDLSGRALVDFVKRAPRRSRHA